MTLSTQIATLTTRIGTEFKAIRSEVAALVGSKASLTTTDKTTIVAAINEVKAGSAGAPPDASVTVKGIVELATNAETTTGTDTTRATTPAGVSAAINALVGGAPGLLDTLDELAAALGDDPNFAATLTTALAGKQPIDTDLTAIAALASAANKVVYSTGSGTWALADFSAAGRALVDDADAAAQRTTLSVYSQAEVGDVNSDFVSTFNTAIA